MLASASSGFLTDFRSWRSGIRGIGRRPPLQSLGPATKGIPSTPKQPSPPAKTQLQL